MRSYFGDTTLDNVDKKNADGLKRLLPDKVTPGGRRLSSQGRLDTARRIE